MTMRNALFSLFMLTAVSVPAATPADRIYYQEKKQLVTVLWNAPFDYQSIRSTDAPFGPYLGNGDVGVVAYTAPNSQTLMYAKVDFVSDGVSDWAGDGAAARPVGEVSISVNSAKGDGFSYEMRQYEAELAMRTGTADPVEMLTWMTMDDNYVVTRLKNVSAQNVSVNVITAARVAPGYPTTANIAENMAQVTRSTLSEGTAWVSSAGISTRIVGVTVIQGNTDGHSAGLCFELAAGKEVYVVTYVSGGGEGNDANLGLARQKLQKAGKGSLRKMRKAHDVWWEDMWNRSYVDTGDTLLNRQYLTSVYLLASAHSEHSPACGGMYGVWNMEDDVKYHGDIHLNYNSQGGFYSVFSANRPEIALPFLRLLTRMIPEGRRRAREDMGGVHPSLAGKSCRGILFPVSLLGTGRFYGPYWQQTMDAPFSVPLFSWYYEYTGDLGFLRREAYPYIRECGDFYEDYLQKETLDDGNYRYTIVTGEHENSWDLNPPSDLAFVWQTFTLLLKYSETLGVDEERRALWQDIVEHLPDYKVILPQHEPNGGKPVFAKNEAGWDLPAHVIQLHACYPCEQINLQSNPKILDIARHTLFYYGVSQQGFTETMNELGLSAFVMGARIGFDADILLDKMRILCRRADKNLLIHDDNHCLEKAAVIETLHSMMLQIVNGELYLFPCWNRTPASFTRLRTKGAFLVSSATDGREVLPFTIVSERGNCCKVRNPWPGRRVNVHCNGKRIDTRTAEQGFCFTTEAGKTYTVSPE